MEEADGMNFDQVRANAGDIWNDKLNKIAVDGGTTINKTKFYTALYRTLLVPRTFSDADGSYYSHFEDRIIQEKDFTYYVDFSLWDTYRTAHPMYTILEPQRQTDMIKTFLAMYDQGGRIPNQVSYRNFYSHEMIGDHGTTTIVDSYMKGIRGFDVPKAYEAMMKNALEPGDPNSSRVGLAEYTEYGYIPAETGIRETVSKVLEDTYTDWVLAQVSLDLGKTDDYNFLRERAHNYSNLYDPETGYYRPRLADGSWLPRCTRYPEIVRVGNNSYYDCWHPDWIGVSPHRHYTESNAWQYLFNPQHDIHGLIDLMGGRERFIERLDGLFYTSSSNLGPMYSVTSAIGQYVHGNQPTHHMAFLYNYAGAPWKTQERVRGILDVFYRADEWGLPGNEDMGEQSSWFLFSSLGFYPVTPGFPEYTITSPLFEKAVINLDEYYDNRKFTILAHNASLDNKYIQSAVLNGRTLSRTWITHDEIVSGGTLEFQMGPEPNKSWGAAPEDAPSSMSKR
jgi:predicted alpha-1,2-mannosidase